jgi:hypothetical protein
MMKSGSSLSAEDKNALQHFRALDAGQKQSALSFMAFLATQESAREEREAIKPEIIARPKEESVIKAIKRLRASYPMLDQNQLFHVTSEKMMDHLMHGKTAPVVIDELEALFIQKYRLYTDGFSS